MQEKVCNQPNQFDNSNYARLCRMGLLGEDGEIDNAMLDTFSRVAAGQFLDDLWERLSTKEQVMAVIEAFNRLALRKEYQQMYLMLSLQYDRIRKPLPDSLWSMSEHPSLQRAFSFGFYQHLLELAARTMQEEESHRGKDETAGSSPG